MSSKAVLCTTRSSSNTNGGSNGSSRRAKSQRWDQPETSHSTGSLLSSMERFVQTVDDMNETILVPCRLMDLQFDDTFIPTSSSATPVNSSHIMGLSNGYGGSLGAAGSKTLGLNGGVLSNLNGVDLYQFYSVLNNIKNDLMWGRKGMTSTSVIPINPSIMMGIPPLSSSSSAASVISQLTTHSSSSSSSSSSSAGGSILPSSQQVPNIAINGHGDGHQNGTNPSSSTHVKGHARRPSTVSTTSSTSASDTEFSELNEDSGVEAEQEGGDHDHTSSSVDDDACTTQSQSQSVAEAFHHHLNGLQQCLCDLTIAAEHVTHRYNNALGSSSL
jgi:hypothetical protein